MTWKIARTAALAAAWCLAAAPARTAPDAMSQAQMQIGLWPNQAKDLAGSLLGEYGAPDETAEDRLSWINAAPWSRIVVYRDPQGPDQPAHLLQAVPYRVPLKKWRSLSAFHRGAAYDPVREELVARTDREDTNFLALNLAEEVVRARRTGAEADAFFDKTVALSYSGKGSAYLRKLLFSPARPR